MKNEAKFWSRFFLTAAVLIQSFVALAKFYWIFELFTHYAHYYVLIALAFLLFHGYKKNGQHALAWTVLFILNLTSIAPYLTTPQPIASNSAESLSIFAQNVHCEDDDLGEFYAQVQRLKPDIFVVNEANSSWESIPEDILSLYPYTHLTQETGVHGIFMGSLTPGTFTEIQLTEEVGLEFKSKDNAYRVLGVHPQAPMNSDWAADRNKQFTDIATYANSSEIPTVIIGDFNSTPWSPYFKDLLSQSGLRDSRLGFGLVPTWKANSLLFWLPIDHALVSSDFEVLNFESFPTKVSDHKSILLSLRRID